MIEAKTKQVFNDVGLAEGITRESNPSSHSASPRVTLRLTPDELTRLKYMSAGVCMSAYIRECVFGETAAKRKRRSHVPVKDQQALASALALLGQSRMANNLNQIAKHANCGSLVVDEDVERKIEEAYSHICHMRASLITALGLIENQ